MAQITTTEVVNGQVTDAGVINSNFTAIKTAINGGLDNSNIKPASNIDPAKIAPSPTDTHVLTTVGGQAQWAAPPVTGGQGTTPAGAMVMWATPSAPSGWLICNGDPVLRATYADLFAAIGTTYGAGDGSSTFNLPDMRGRAPYGMYPTTPGVASMGANEGQANVALRGPHHGHSASAALTNTGGVQALYGPVEYPQNGYATHTYTPWVFHPISNVGVSVSVGAQGYSVQNAPSHMAIHFIIKT